MWTKVHKWTIFKSCKLVVKRNWGMSKNLYITCKVSRLCHLTRFVFWRNCIAWLLTHILMQIHMTFFFYCPIIFAPIMHSTVCYSKVRVVLFQKWYFNIPGEELEVIKLTEQHSIYIIYIYINCYVLMIN